MNILWGLLMVIIGFLMFLGGFSKSEFVVYKLLHARAEKLWKENAHTFLMISGIVIVLLSNLFFFNIWG